MCKCEINKAPQFKQSNIEELILNKEKRKDMTEKVVLSKKAFVDGNLHEFLKFTWAIDKEKLVEAFAKYGIIIESFGDLKTLAMIAEKGLDRSGKIEIKGKPIYFSVMDILRTIDVSNEKLESAKIIWTE